MITLKNCVRSVALASLLITLPGLAQETAALDAGSGGPLALRALAYSTDGKVGYIIGACSESLKDPDDGKFILALRKDANGRWLIAADIDNSNRRSGPAAQ